MTDFLEKMKPMIPPSPWVEMHCQLFPRGGRLLDLACGRGRHARLLAARGHAVLAVDRDADALACLADCPGVSTRCLELETDSWPLAGEHFAGVVVSNYLWRRRLPEVLALLAPGGILIYETFMRGNEAYGKPSRPEFLLEPGELRQVVAAAGLVELAFAEGYAGEPRPAMRQAIVARRPI